jgi:hypothetical protein
MLLKDDKLINHKIMQNVSKVPQKRLCNTLRFKKVAHMCFKVKSRLYGNEILDIACF